MSDDRSNDRGNVGSSPIPPGHLEIGHIRRAHGLRGEVFVQLLNDDAGRLVPGTVLRTARTTFTVVTSRTASSGRRVVKFEQVNDRNAAERLANEALYAEPLDDPDALWAHDLIGKAVVEVDGTERGECRAVLANPAADLLELDSGALVPSVFVVSVADGVITIDVPDGLFDLT
jgi:16S rRNA processing protein RimM